MERTADGATPWVMGQVEAVTVDERGEVIQRQVYSVRRFVDELPGGLRLEMVVIPAGSFLMGSRAGIGYADEHPQHSVRVRSFLISQYPITQAQWQAVMGRLPPCRSHGPSRPVDRVSWHDAQAFCARLSRRTGRAYRLPGEAEWEYACRAGTFTPFYTGETITTDLANYVGEHTYGDEPKGVYRHESTDVGSFPPNAYGLYDMHGNVWEWCADAWHGDYVGAPSDGTVWGRGPAARYVLRGGCWHDPPDLCRSAARLGHAANEGEDFFGFRVALGSIEPGASSTAGSGDDLAGWRRHLLGRWRWLGRKAGR